jgi:hypothetical protein
MKASTSLLPGQKPSNVTVSTNTPLASQTLSLATPQTTVDNAATTSPITVRLPPHGKASNLKQFKRDGRTALERLAENAIQMEDRPASRAYPKLTSKWNSDNQGLPNTDAPNASALDSSNTDRNLISFDGSRMVEPDTKKALSHVEDLFGLEMDCDIIMVDPLAPAGFVTQHTVNPTPEASTETWRGGDEDLIDFFERPVEQTLLQNIQEPAGLHAQKQSRLEVTESDLPMIILLLGQSKVDSIQMKGLLQMLIEGKLTEVLNVLQDTTQPSGVLSPSKPQSPSPGALTSSQIGLYNGDDEEKPDSGRARKSEGNVRVGVPLRSVVEARIGNHKFSKVLSPPVSRWMDPHYNPVTLSHKGLDLIKGFQTLTEQGGQATEVPEPSQYYNHSLSNLLYSPKYQRIERQKSLFLQNLEKEEAVQKTAFSQPKARHTIEVVPRGSTQGKLEPAYSPRSALETLANGEDVGDISPRLAGSRALSPAHQSRSQRNENVFTQSSPLILDISTNSVKRDAAQVKAAIFHNMSKSRWAN